VYDKSYALCMQAHVSWPLHTCKILVSIVWLMQSTMYVSDKYHQKGHVARHSGFTASIYCSTSFATSVTLFLPSIFSLSFNFPFSFFFHFFWFFILFCWIDFWVDNEGQESWKPSASSVCEPYLPHMQISGRINGFLPERSWIFPH